MFSAAARQAASVFAHAQPGKQSDGKKSRPGMPVQGGKTPHRRRKDRTKEPAAITIAGASADSGAEYGARLGAVVSGHFTVPGEAEQLADHVSAKTLRKRIQETATAATAAAAAPATAWLEPVGHTACYEATVWAVGSAANKTRLLSLVRSAFGIDRSLHSSVCKRLAVATAGIEPPGRAVAAEWYCVLLKNLAHYETVQYYSRALEKMQQGDRPPRLKLLPLGDEAALVHTLFLNSFQVDNELQMLGQTRTIRCFAEHSVHFGKTALAFFRGRTLLKKCRRTQDEEAECMLLRDLVQDNVRGMWRVFADHTEYRGALGHHLQLLCELSPPGIGVERIGQCLDLQTREIFFDCVRRASCAVARDEAGTRPPPPPPPPLPVRDDETSPPSMGTRELAVLCDLLDECMHDTRHGYKHDFDKYASGIDVCAVYASGLCRLLDEQVCGFAARHGAQSGEFCAQALPLVKKLGSCAAMLVEHSPQDNDCAQKMLRHLDPYVGMWVADTLKKIGEWTVCAARGKTAWTSTLPASRRDSAPPICVSLVDAFQACAQSINFVRERPYLCTSIAAGARRSRGCNLFARLALDRCATVYEACAMDAQLGICGIGSEKTRDYEYFSRNMCCTHKSGALLPEFSEWWSQWTGCDEESAVFEACARVNSVEHTRTIIANVAEQMSLDDNDDDGEDGQFVDGILRRHKGDAMHPATVLAYSVCLRAQPILVMAMQSRVRADMRRLVQDMLDEWDSCFEVIGPHLHMRLFKHVRLVVWRHACTVLCKILAADPLRTKRTGEAAILFGWRPFGPTVHELEMGAAVDAVQCEWVGGIIEYAAAHLDSRDYSDGNNGGNAISAQGLPLFEEKACPEYTKLWNMLVIFKMETQPLLDLAASTKDCATREYTERVLRLRLGKTTTGGNGTVATG